MSNLNVTNIQHESGAGDNLILAADGTTTIPGGTNRPKIVGYQQGIWEPWIRKEDNSFNYMTNGVVDPEWMTAGECNHYWYRIGNQVTVNSYATWKKADTSETSSNIFWEGLPYLIAAKQEGKAYRPFTGSLYYYNIKDVTPGTVLVPYYWNGSGGGSDNRIRFRFVGSLTNLKSSQVNTSFYMTWTTTYLTDDTDWQPLNGATVDS